MKPLAQNKKAFFDYKILEKYEAGMVLIGTEVKSIKMGRINIQGSYVIFKGKELFLLGSNVPAYQPKNAPEKYNPEQPRKLLLRRKEINELIGKTKEKGLTLVPLKVYTRHGLIKIEIGLAKGAKKADKREKIKKKEADRKIRRALKSSQSI